MIVSNFDFDPLRVDLGPYGSFFDETNTKNNCHVRNWGMKPFLYAIHQHSEKRIDIHCKVTFGLKNINFNG